MDAQTLMSTQKVMGSIFDSLIKILGLEKTQHFCDYDCLDVKN